MKAARIVSGFNSLRLDRPGFVGKFAIHFVSGAVASLRLLRVFAEQPVFLHLLIKSDTADADCVSQIAEPSTFFSAHISDGYDLSSRL